ncbi:MAG: prepilin-type N-terminal cleavage/methylation domain-containing protein [Sulfuricurvum sp.]|nr:prepilin-type N-terminal cleavage/methylation domain-containing protein [Sulfuricurvum sp.]
MKRFAFTLLELVFVLIVIGILAVLAMPNFRGHPLQDAAQQVADHIRYTQHLAMIDDKYDPSDTTWWQTRWQLTIAGTSYDLYSDRDKDGALTAGEAAVDPLTKTPIAAIDLGADYGITAITAATIAFDNMGRPYNALATIYGGLIQADTNITLSHNDGQAIITIHPETGYVSVTYP